MRAALLVLFAIGGAAHADPPTLARPGTLTLLMVSGDGHAACRAWQVDPAAHQLRSDAIAVDYAITADHLELSALTDHGERHDCRRSWPIYEHADALVVDGARWFRTADACAAALAHHATVATDLGGCMPDPPPAAAALARSRTRFDRVIHHGGTIYAVAECAAVRVAVSRDRATFTSTFEDAQVREVTAQPVEFDPATDRAVLPPPDVQTTSKHGDDPGHFATGGVDEVPLELGAEWFALGQTYYFARGSCRAAHAAESAHDAWLPTVDTKAAQ